MSSLYGRSKNVSPLKSSTAVADLIIFADANTRSQYNAMCKAEFLEKNMINKELHSMFSPTFQTWDKFIVVCVSLSG